MFDVYLITDGSRPGPVVQAVRRALQASSARGGRVAVQLRAKTWSRETVTETARELRRVTHEANALLLVNSEVDIATTVEADGVHLPDDATPIAQARAALGSNAIIGRSCHDAAGLARAAAQGASFATLSPVYAVPDKGPPLGLHAFHRLVADARLPVLGLGGIDVARAPELLAAGAHGVAVQRNVLQAANPSAALQALLEACEQPHLLDTARSVSRRS